MYANSSIDTLRIARNNSLTSGIINLTDTPTDEAIESAKWFETRHIKIYTKNWQRINIIKESISIWLSKVGIKVFSSCVSLILSIQERLERKIENSGGGIDFSERYSEEDIVRLAMMLPKDCSLTLSGVLKFYPLLSKRQIYKVISERKNNFPRLRYRDEFSHEEIAEIPA